ncbi:MAG: hypothetical protein Q4G63_02425 [Bacteroidia bacterium]|nr:hypothetical protein [Bacteroidia bacterium]
MKTIQHILYSCLLVLLAVSCIKDDSIGEVNPVSKIELASKIDTLFTLDRWATLQISAPQFTQTNAEKPLSYSWEIDHKEVSTEKDLTYVCEKYGVFDGRLKVSNEDGFFFHYFKVNVRYSYIQGVYALASHKGKSILSYYPEGIADKTFELDTYEKNNPIYKLGTEPKALFFTNTPIRQEVYIATGNPSTLYRLDGNLMMTTHQMETQGDITFITHDGANSVITSAVFLLNKRAGQVESQKTTFTNFGQQSIDGTFGAVEFANRISYWYTSASASANGELYFDNIGSRMIIRSSNKSSPVAELFKSEFAGLTLIDVCQANDKSEFAAVLKNKQSGEFVHYWFNPGYYNQYNTAKETAPEMKYKGTMPASSGIIETSVIASAPAKNIMYYTNGNKVYAYSILSKGNFPTTPLFVCESSGNVADMFVNKEESKLYVGINDSNPDLPGSIYCFDINKNTLLWKQTNVTGTIKQLVYKYP